MKIFFAFLLTLILIFSACIEKYDFKVLPSSNIKHHLIVLAKNSHQVTARGFSGATPPGINVRCQIGDINKSTKSSHDGSFSINLTNIDESSDWGEFTFNIHGQSLKQKYKIKNLSSSLAQVARPPFEGQVVDAIAFMDQEVAVLSQEAATVSSFEVDEHFQLISQKQKNTILLNMDNIKSLAPRMIERIGKYFIVPLFDTHELALIDPKKNECLKTRLKDEKNQLYRFIVTPNLVVKNSIDAADQGEKRKIINKTTARNAEAVFALDDRHFLASFVNYYQYADWSNKNYEAIVGPGIIALIAIENGKLITRQVSQVKFKNPQYFFAKKDHSVWLSCSGTWYFASKDTLKSKDAGLIRIDLTPDNSNYSIVQEIPLANFSPAKPALVKNKIIIPRSYSNEIAIIDETAKVINPSQIKKLDFHRDIRFTFASLWHDWIIFLGEAAGALIAYDLNEGFFPFPFIEPIRLNTAIDLKMALAPLEIYFRHQVDKKPLKDHYPTGFNAWVISAERTIYPLDFLAVFGP
jgi:hypothetical protein